MTHATNKNLQRGFGLVELLVAMGLSLLLLAGVATMFVSTRGAYETNDRLARLEENGRFALDTISRDVRAAGYPGCSTEAGPYVAVNNTNNFLSQEDPTDSNIQNPSLGTDRSSNSRIIHLNAPIQGHKYVSPGLWDPVLPNYARLPANGSDVLVTRGPLTGVPPLDLTVNMTSFSDDITVAPNSPITNHQLLMIGDCSSRSYFEVTDYNRATGVIKHALLGGVSGPNGYNGNWTGELAKKYEKRNLNGSPDAGGAQLYTFQTSIYYVALSTTSALDPNNPQYNSLWRQVDSNAPQELIEGVDRMQFLYGLDTNGDGIPDSTNTVAADATQIASITISLLVRSLEEYGSLHDDTDHHMFSPTAQPAEYFPAPHDRRQRQLFTTTIYVRNR